MTDELTSEQEAAVRRLLAEARHDAPVPGDVAARLDEVLDRLVAQVRTDGLEGHESTAPGSVTDLAGMRRRRRNAGRLLLAAAAVVVGGVAVGQSVGDAGLDSAGGDADQGGAVAEAPRDTTTTGRDQQEAGAADGSEVAPEAASGSGVPLESYLLERFDAPFELTSDNFADDVRRELARTAADRRQAANAGYDGLTAFTAAHSDFVCEPGAYGEGAALPAYYDAEEAVLVLRRPRAGVQRVDLLTCGTAVRLNSVDLPAS